MTLERWDKKLKDEIIVCVECGEMFDFKIGEQIFYHDRKIPTWPLRCRECRAKRKAMFEARWQNQEGMSDDTD